MNNYKQKPKIVVNEETKAKLDELGKKNDTYDDIVNKLLKNNNHVKVYI